MIMIIHWSPPKRDTNPVNPDNFFDHMRATRNDHADAFHIRTGTHAGVAYELIRSREGYFSKWWCGYVQVPGSHPFAGKTTSQLYDMDTGAWPVTFTEHVRAGVEPSYFHGANFSIIGIDGHNGPKRFRDLVGTELVTTLEEVRARVFEMCEKITLYQPNQEGA